AAVATVATGPASARRSTSPAVPGARHDGVAPEAATVVDARAEGPAAGVPRRAANHPGGTSMSRIVMCRVIGPVLLVSLGFGSAAAHEPYAYPAQAQQPGYVYLNAPLNPTPRADVPVQMGGTYITNQAFAPHEMLYAHDYKALYPPYYHRVRGNWVVTPFGVKSDERWELQGTQVTVKYRSKIPFWTGFVPTDRTFFANDDAARWSNSPNLGRLGDR
ncbi:MAG: hypothetical protein AAGJ97_12025, partial [Planctomycetota bacterium]